MCFVSTETFVVEEVGVEVEEAMVDPSQRASLVVELLEEWELRRLQEALR